MVILCTGLVENERLFVQSIHIECNLSNNVVICCLIIFY